MNLPPLYTLEGLVRGRVLRRYKRFLADVVLPDGRECVVHCANTGTMRTCWEEGDEVLLAMSTDPRRKLPFTWIACRRGDSWVGIDTLMPNRVMAEACRQGRVPGLGRLAELRTEVPYGDERSRIDIWGLDETGRQVFLEVKNTTLRLGTHACFPDARTVRGLKHLRELETMVQRGHRAILVPFVHRVDVAAFDAAREIDPEYARGLDQAEARGVEVRPLQVKIDSVTSSDGTSSAAWGELKEIPWIRLV